MISYNKSINYLDNIESIGKKLITSYKFTDLNEKKYSNKIFCLLNQ